MQIIYTELKNTLEYVCSINVFDTQMLMRVSYNSRSKKRLISLTSLDESILFLKPTYITEGSRVFPNVNAKLNGLSFYITLNPLSFSGENYKDWANQYQLCFVEYTPYTNLTTDRFYVNKNLDGQGYVDEDTSVTPSFGDWVVTKVEIVNQDIKYFGEKTNTIDTYDSYALYPLEQALVNSFHDVDMQQWQAFKDAVNELTGVTNWFVDPANNQIRYKEPSDPSCTATKCDPTLQKVYKVYGAFGKTPEEACANAGGQWEPGIYPCKKGSQQSKPLSVTNPAYDPDAEPNDKPEKTLPLDVVAQKVISNTSSPNEGVSLLAEAYIDEVVNSINEPKQFVSMLDLVDQFEANKTLRS